jgi:hypothetical protein
MFMPALRPPGTFDPNKDPRVLQVRTRRAQDLNRLRQDYLPELGKTIKLAGTDYEYRAYCTKAQWGAALARMADDIGYVKFKDTARDDQLHSLYLEMWGSILRHLSPGFQRRSKRDRKRGRDSAARSDWWSYIPATGTANLWTDRDWADAFTEMKGGER